MDIDEKLGNSNALPDIDILRGADMVGMSDEERYEYVSTKVGAYMEVYNAQLTMEPPLVAMLRETGLVSKASSIISPTEEEVVLYGKEIFP